jgi:hypothetical protein
MLELLTTDAFATWFSALPAGPAEDVAATLEVIVQLGTSTEAPGSSEMLLWYEHPVLSQRRVPGLEAPGELPPQFVKFTQDWGQLLGYTKRVIKHLESKAFVARLASLSADDAAAVAEGVKRLRRLTTNRVLAMSEYQVKHMLRHLHSPTAASTEALARLSDVSELREAYFAVLTAAGFEVADVTQHTAALREISLRGTAPGLRMLYGIDEPRNRGLVVVGEWLDRSFYGDTVRHAEAVWREFLEGRPLSARAASAG